MSRSEDEGPLDKMTVYLSCVSSFNESSHPPSKSRHLLTQLVRLIYKGETFPEDEATQLFFTITKLFQQETPGLRQMVYLAIRELRPFTDNVIMGTSVVMKDVQSAHDQIYRPNAIRALCQIIDAANVEGIDRLMRAAIVDRDGSVSSAGLVSAYHLLRISKDTVRRWSTETLEALTTPKTYSLGPAANPGLGPLALTQYHALGLLYHMRVHDRVALLKMIHQLAASNSSLRSAYAIVLLVRFVGSVIEEDKNLRPTLFSYLEGWLRHRSDMVNLEAAKVILSLKNLTAAEAQSTVLVLQAFLGSPRATSRFAAIRLLNRFANQNPQVVAVCNTEVEGLVTDSNYSIATYAITTLLKTGSEESVDHLITQVSGFIDDIGDDFRVIVVDAIRSLALKFPSKHDAMLGFFTEELHNDGGLKLKTSIVEALFDIVRESQSNESKEAALSHLCDYIEDCDFPELIIRILHLLGVAGPSSSNPGQYVRYIYNRVVLENSVVRAAAVAALSKFALVDEDKLGKSAQILLRRCLQDPTDEVRDRAAFSLGVLGLGKSVAQDFLVSKVKLSLPQLEKNLLAYIGDSANFRSPFHADDIPRVTDEQRVQDARKRLEPEVVPAAQEEPEKPAPLTDTLQYKTELQAIPEFAEFGQLLHSSPAPIPLTESEMEYVVKAVVHIYPNHLVVQLDVDNTYDAILENLRAEIDLDDLEPGLLEEQLFVPLERLEPNSQGTLYVAYTRSSDFILGSLSCRLRYFLKETADDEGLEEEYPLDDLALVPGDYLLPKYTGSFDHQWDELLNDEATNARQLPECRDLDDAAKFVAHRLGLMSDDGAGAETTRMLQLFGTTLDGSVSVAARVKLVRSSRSGVAAKVVVRTSGELAEVIVSGF